MLSNSKIDSYWEMGHFSRFHRTADDCLVPARSLTEFIGAEKTKSFSPFQIFSFSYTRAGVARKVIFWFAEKYFSHQTFYFLNEANLKLCVIF